MSELLRRGMIAALAPKGVKIRIADIDAPETLD
jgi:endonuclease YncB( thermonuclease family)